MNPIPVPTGTVRVIPLSAMNEEALWRRAEDLLAALPGSAGVPWDETARVLADDLRCSVADLPDDEPLVDLGVSPTALASLGHSAGRAVAALGYGSLGRLSIADLRRALEGAADRPEVALEDVAFTLSCGREPMPRRLAVVAGTVGELRERIAGWLAGRVPEGVHVGVAEAADGPAPTSPEELAAFWVRGGPVDWDAEFAGEPVRRLSLPTYRFASRRHWIEAPEGEPPALNAPGALGADGSVAVERSRRAPVEEKPFGAAARWVVAPGDAVVREHVVDGVPTLPGVVHLSRMYSAARAYTAGPAEIREVVWVRTATVPPDGLGLAVSCVPEGTEVRTAITAEQDGPDTRAVFSEGTWTAPETAAERRIDVAAALASCVETHDADGFYRALAARGLGYGPLYRGVRELHVGEDRAVAEFGSERGVDEALDPTVLDAALQSVAGLHMAEMARGAGTVLPFALDRFTLFTVLPTRGWIVTRRFGETYDLDITDPDGAVAAELRGLRVRRKPGPATGDRGAHVTGATDGSVAGNASGPITALPRWRPAVTPPGPAVRGGSALVIAGHGVPGPVVEGLTARYSGTTALVRSGAVDVPGGPWEDIWLLIDDSDTSDAGAGGTSRAVVDAFRTVRALIDDGVLGSAARFTVVLPDIFGVRGHTPEQPSAAGVLGLVRSLSQEVHGPETRCVSVEGPIDGALLDRVAQEPPLRSGHDVVLTPDGRHVRELVPVDLRPSGSSAFRDGGRYVITGGLGGIGFELARHLCRRYRARVVLTGRRAADAGVRERLAELDSLGGRAEYRAVDAADAPAMRALLADLRRDGQLHGVVHSAFVLDDAILERQTEERFTAALRPKIEGTAHLLDALAGERPDFVLVMGSAQSFVGAPGQANYAAASTGMDALALWGRRALGLPVRVVHWSHWGAVGAVARPEYAASLGAAGWRPIETAEGMDVLERFLATDLPCLVGAKAEPSTLKKIGLRAGTGRADADALLALDTVDADAYERVERHLAALAEARLRDVREVVPAARRHVAALRAVTAEFTDGRTAAETEDMEAPTVPPLVCRLDLARSCVERVAEYVSGALTAHDVVFPTGEPDMLARFYHEEPFNDRAQRVLADEVLRLAQERRREGRPPLSVLEVGAGTGSTTTHVVERLRGAGLGVRYHVTDVSDRLLDQARERIGTDGVTYSRLDLGSPDDLARYGEVDVVVAGNVLHAVPGLDEVLGRLRALLSPDGVLLLSELVRTSVFHTIVFGMFDAWWPEDDETRRQPHSPLLDAAAWRDRLGAAGFGPVRTTGIGPRGGRAVQAVLLALNDPTTPPSTHASSGEDMQDAELDQGAAPVRRVDPRGAARDTDTGDGPDVRSWVRDTIVRVTADTLGMSVDEFTTDTPFATIGVDSLVGVELVGTIGGELGVRLKTLVVFDHPTADRLADHIVDAHADELRPPEREPEVAPHRPAPVRPQVATEQHADGTASARAVVFDAPGDVGDLAVRGIQVRPPGEGEVEVAVAAFPVNFSDGLVARGLYPMMPDFPVVPGVEVSGTVSRVGPGVDSVAPGDAVVALTPPEMGGQATSVIVDADFAVRKPAGVAHEDACGLPAAHLAMSLALDTAGVCAGETVVITGAAGNNGLVAVQLARGRNARVIGTAGSPAKVEYLRSLGIEALNYAEDDLPDRLRELTGGAATGADVVVNTLGGDAIQQAMRLVGPGGRYIETAVFGLRASGPLDLSAFVHNQSFHSLNAKKYFLDHPERRAEYLARFADDLASGAVRATTAAVYGFADVHEAYSRKQDRALVGRVVVRTDTASFATASAPERPSVASAPSGTWRDDIAIVGMSARYAGARDPDELWELLASGRDVRTTVPDGRWDRVRYVSADRDRLDTTYCDHGYFVDGIDEFDAPFFGMSSHEAAQTDPQQRVFLQEAWRALEVAGMTRNRARAARVGVFAGAGTSGYEKRMDATGAVRRAQSFWGNDSSVLASRISYALDLSGPSVSINTACSSSLVAIHTACRSILDGDCDTALAGGVFLMLDPQYFVVASNGGMLAPDGRCKTFSAAADGFGPGEGAGVVVLRRLSDALRDGDHVWGLVRGSAINQDGRTNGITAPSGTAQTAVVRAAHTRAGVDARSIGYVEAHGTGTKLGDPIEVEALTNAFGPGPDHGPVGGAVPDGADRCLIGSAKAVIGHTAAAAGVAGVIKVCLAFDREEVPVSPNGEPGNPLIDFDNGPFRLARGEPWPSGGPRRAGVSSFGFSGTNAHAVLEEPAPRPAAAEAPGPWLFPVTAEDPDLLRARLDTLAAWLGARGGRYALADIAHTLQSRRDHGPVRCVVGAGSVDELVAALSAVGEGEERLPAGLADAGPAVRRFVADADEPWPEAERTEGRAVPVPARPLCRERHWFPEDAQWHRHRDEGSAEEQPDRLEALVDRVLAGEIDEDEVLSMLGDSR